MNREIKFRGKDKQGRWWKGDLRHTMMELGKPHCRIVNVDKDDYDRLQEIWSDTIQEDTIGQFTGFYDTNGQPIYEGDILKCRIKTSEHIPYVVGYRLGLFETRPNNQDLASSPLKYLLNDDDEGTALKSWTVIGNIHDNPELMEGGAQ